MFKLKLHEEHLQQTLKQISEQFNHQMSLIEELDTELQTKTSELLIASLIKRVCSKVSTSALEVKVHELKLQDPDYIQPDL
jgi:FKBP-type peptidyl-prolyl cis-trans isomerase (trigger factor)